MVTASVSRLRSLLVWGLRPGDLVFGTREQQTDHVIVFRELVRSLEPAPLNRSVRLNLTDAALNLPSFLCEWK